MLIMMSAHGNDGLMIAEANSYRREIRATCPWFFINHRYVLGYVRVLGHAPRVDLIEAELSFQK